MQTQQVINCGFSPDGSKIVSCSDDKTVRVWDASTSKLIHTMEGHTDEVSEKHCVIMMQSNVCVTRKHQEEPSITTTQSNKQTNTPK
jgi:WD40 repeat protein